MNTASVQSATKSSAVSHTLDATERADLARLETIVDRGLTGFVEVGSALLEISDRRLYRETHSTFEEYCRDKWKMTARRAYQLCEAAEVVKALPENVNHGSQINERQARELAKVPIENRVAVLESAGGNGKVTAAAIRQAYADTEICRAAAAIREEKNARRKAGASIDMVMPPALNPIEPNGRIMRVMVNSAKQQCMLVIGPNEAGTKLPGWWKTYMESAEHKAAQAKAEALEQEAEELAKALKEQAHQVRQDAKEHGRQQFVALHGTPIHYVETFDIPFPRSKLPKETEEAARCLLDGINSGKLKTIATGCWGDMCLPFPMIPRPCDAGWAHMGSPGWLNEFFPDLTTNTGGPAT